MGGPGRRWLICSWASDLENVLWSKTIRLSKHWWSCFELCIAHWKCKNGMDGLDDDGSKVQRSTKGKPPTLCPFHSDYRLILNHRFRPLLSVNPRILNCLAWTPSSRKKDWSSRARPLSVEGNSAFEVQGIEFRFIKDFLCSQAQCLWMLVPRHVVGFGSVC